MSNLLVTKVELGAVVPAPYDGADTDTVLLITASDGDRTYVAIGWHSATTNHYDPADYVVYDEKDAANADLSVTHGRQLRPNATPRPMTPEEVGEYALSLIFEQHPELRQAAEVSTEPPVAFVAPAAVVVPDPVTEEN